MEKQKPEAKKKKSRTIKSAKLDEKPAEPVLNYEKNHPEDGRPLGEKVNLKTAVLFFSIIILGAVLFRYKNILIAATVDGQPIFRSEIISELEKQGGKQVLDSIITKKLIEKEAKSKAIVVTTEEVDAEIDKIKNSIKEQGSTLEAELANQNMTVDVLKKEISMQKKVEKILLQNISVTDDEVNQYIESNKDTIPEGTDMEIFKEQVREQLKGQKMSSEYQTWIEKLKETAKINTFVKY